MLGQRETSQGSIQDSPFLKQAARGGAYLFWAGIGWCLELTVCLCLAVPCWVTSPELCLLKLLTILPRILNLNQVRQAVRVPDIWGRGSLGYTEKNSGPYLLTKKGCKNLLAYWIIYIFRDVRRCPGTRSAAGVVSRHSVPHLHSQVISVLVALVQGMASSSPRGDGF